MRRLAKVGSHVVNSSPAAAAPPGGSSTDPGEMAKKFDASFLAEMKQKAEAMKFDNKDSTKLSLEERCEMRYKIPGSVLRVRIPGEKGEKQTPGQQLAAEIRNLGLEDHIDELEEQGFTVIPPEKAVNPGEEDRDLIERCRLAALRVAEERSGIAPDYETGMTHTDMQSPAGQHLFFMLYEDECFQEALLQRPVRACMKYLLGPSHVISSTTSFMKGPGKVPLPMHADSFIPETRRHPSHANCAYLLSNYEGVEGGAICFVPKSHTLGCNPWDPELQDPRKIGAVPVVAPIGSLVVWNGNTWHGAYPKQTPGLRLNLTLFHGNQNIVTQERYRETVPQSMLDRWKDTDFAELVGQKNFWGFMKEGPNYEPGAPATAARIRFGGLSDAKNPYAEQAAKVAKMNMGGMEMPHQAGEEAPKPGKHRMWSNGEREDLAERFYGTSSSKS